MELKSSNMGLEMEMEWTFHSQAHFRAFSKLQISEMVLVYFRSNPTPILSDRQKKLFCRNAWQPKNTKDSAKIWKIDIFQKLASEIGLSIVKMTYKPKKAL